MMHERSPVPMQTSRRIAALRCPPRGRRRHATVSQPADARRDRCHPDGVLKRWLLRVVHPRKPLFAPRRGSPDRRRAPSLVRSAPTLRPSPRRALAAASLVVLLLGVPGCGEPGAPTSACLDAVRPPVDGGYVRAIHADGNAVEVTFTDGSTHRLPRHPERVVSLLPGVTEIVAMLGLSDVLVGVSPHCDTPTFVEDLPRVSVLPVDYEALVALAPDLILTDRTLHGGEVLEMRRRGLAVLPLESSRSLQHLATSVDLLAQLTGTQEALASARAFRADLDDAVRAAAPPPGSRPPRVFLVAGTDPLYALGPGSLLDDMVRACGGINLACDLGRASGPFASELVPERRPDWILLSGGAFPEILRQRWATVPAVEADRIAWVEGDAFVRAGPRTPEALRRLARVLGGDVPANLLGDRR